MVCHEALQSGHDAVLFLDSDIGIIDETFVDKLLDTAYKLDAKVVGGAYLMKKLDETVYIAGENIGGKFDNLRKRFTQPRLVEGIGTGIMLVFRQALEKVEDPWFSIIDKPNLDVMPEDFEFCRKVIEKGFKVAIDPRFETRHYGQKAWVHT